MGADHLCLTLFMPVMEIVPTSGSIASAVIAVFAAGLLTRDGGLGFAVPYPSPRRPGDGLALRFRRLTDLSKPKPENSPSQPAHSVPDRGES